MLKTFFLPEKIWLEINKLQNRSRFRKFLSSKKVEELWAKCQSGGRKWAGKTVPFWATLFKKNRIKGAPVLSKKVASFKFALVAILFKRGLPKNDKLSFGRFLIGLVSHYNSSMIIILEASFGSTKCLGQKGSRWIWAKKKWWALIIARHARNLAWWMVLKTVL